MPVKDIECTKVEDDLKNMAGIQSIFRDFHKNEILTMEDLAELSIDDLVEMEV